MTSSILATHAKGGPVESFHAARQIACNAGRRMQQEGSEKVRCTPVRHLEVPVRGQTPAGAAAWGCSHWRWLLAGPAPEE